MENCHGRVYDEKVPNEKSTREKRYDMKRERHGRLYCETCSVRGKAAAKRDAMKRVKQNRSKVKVQTAT